MQKIIVFVSFLIYIFFAFGLPYRYKTAWHEFGHIKTKVKFIGHKYPVIMELKIGKGADFIIRHVCKRYNVIIKKGYNVINNNKNVRGFTRFAPEDEDLFTSPIIRKMARAGVKTGLLYVTGITILHICFQIYPMYRLFGLCFEMFLFAILIPLLPLIVWFVVDIVNYFDSSDFKLSRNPKSYWD